MVIVLEGNEEVLLVRSYTSLWITQMRYLIVALLHNKRS